MRQTDVLENAKMLFSLNKYHVLVAVAVQGSL